MPLPRGTLTEPTGGAEHEDGGPCRPRTARQTHSGVSSLPMAFLWLVLVPILIGSTQSLTADPILREKDFADECLAFWDDDGGKAYAISVWHPGDLTLRWSVDIGGIDMSSFDVSNSVLGLRLWDRGGKDDRVWMETWLRKKAVWKIVGSAGGTWLWMAAEMSGGARLGADADFELLKGWLLRAFGQPNFDRRPQGVLLHLASPVMHLATMIQRLLERNFEQPKRKSGRILVTLNELPYGTAGTSKTVKSDTDLDAKTTTKREGLAPL